MNPAGLHEIASAAFERMVYSLAEGSLLTFVVAVVLRLLPARTSQTRFAIWLSALLGIVTVTLFGLHGASGIHGSGSPSLLTLPVSVALGAFALWALLAISGMARIVLGLWQLRKVRQQCEPVSGEELPAEVRELVQAFQSIRRVTLLQAHDSHTPKAVGFFDPAIILPKWLLDEGTADQLKHVLLHELAHLRRRDDWTNLFQQVVKALFFFHPAIWWMERELALSREQACDDAALEQTADARDYARSLALVAEKSFLRRQLALAQAVVGRAQQLTQRVTRILDPKRPVKNHTWKPAVSLVALAAAACGFSASWTPALVKIQDGSALSANAQAVQATSVAATHSSPGEGFGVKAWPASMKLDQNAQQPRVKSSATHSARANVAKSMTATDSQRGALASHTQTHSPMVMTSHAMAPQSEFGKPTKAAEAADGLVLLVATQQTITAGPNGWRVEVSEVRWLVPAKAFYKPAPSKT